MAVKKTDLKMKGILVEKEARGRERQFCHLEQLELGQGQLQGEEGAGRSGWRIHGRGEKSR
jgi:hypothetical protein